MKFNWNFKRGPDMINSNMRCIEMCVSDIDKRMLDDKQ